MTTLILSGDFIPNERAYDAIQALEAADRRLVESTGKRPHLLYRMVSDFIHPLPEYPSLPLLLNILIAGIGTIFSGMMKPNGMSYRTIGLGILSCILCYLSLFFAVMTFGITLLSAAFWYVLGLYIGYLCYVETSET